MKLRILTTMAMAAGFSLLSIAQTHKEGVEYFKADQFDNAKELLLRNMNNSGTDKSISNYYLGLIALEEENSAEAKKYFDSGIQANPEYPFNYVGLGQLALMNGDLKAAEDDFKQAKKLNKNKEEKTELSIAIARAYYNVDPKKYENQINKNVEDAYKSSNKEKGTNAVLNPEYYIFEGDRARDLRDAGKAGNLYEMATKYDPNATEAYVKYANLFTQVNPQYAITMLGELLNVNPESALGQRELANAYYNASKYKEAAAEYEKYVKNPNHFKQDEDRLAFLLFYDQNYQKGYDFASQLLKNNPSNFTAQRFQFMNAAQIDSMRDKLLPMAESLLAAHKANPANKFAPIDYILIGSEFLDADRAPEAQALFEEAIEVDPTNAEYNKQLAQVFIKENQISNAADAFEGYLAKKKDPGYNDFVQQATYAFYAGIENQQENPDEAQKYFTLAESNAKKAQELSSEYPRPYKILGDIKKQTASSELSGSAAVQDYTDAITIFENMPDNSRYTSDAIEMYKYLGNNALKQKDNAAAKEYFSKALALDPGNESLQKLVNGL